MKRSWIALALLLLGAPAWARPVAVETVSIPVADLERSIPFYRDVLDFTPGTPVEVAGEDYEQGFGLFGVRVRVARGMVDQGAVGSWRRGAEVAA